MVGTLALCPLYEIAMDQNAFLAAALKNPVNEAITRELDVLALPDAWLVSGLPGADGVERDDRSRA